jgi:hypothetical protein
VSRVTKNEGCPLSPGTTPDDGRGKRKHCTPRTDIFYNIINISGEIIIFFGDVLVEPKDVPMGRRAI